MNVNRTITEDEFEGLVDDTNSFITRRCVSEHRWFDRWLYVFYTDGQYLGCYQEHSNHEDGEHEGIWPVEMFPVEPYEYKEVRYRPIT